MVSPIAVYTRRDRCGAAGSSACSRIGAATSGSHGGPGGNRPEPMGPPDERQGRGGRESRVGGSAFVGDFPTTRLDSTGCWRGRRGSSPCDRIHRRRPWRRCSSTTPGDCGWRPGTAWCGWTSQVPRPQFRHYGRATGSAATRCGASPRTGWAPLRGHAARCGSVRPGHRALRHFTTADGLANDNGWAGGYPLAPWFGTSRGVSRLEPEVEQPSSHLCRHSLDRIAGSPDRYPSSDGSVSRTSLQRRRSGSRASARSASGLGSGSVPNAAEWTRIGRCQPARSSRTWSPGHYRFAVRAMMAAPA
jgi:hypothetical protein